MRISKVIFDWSGTLSDDAENCHRAAMKTREHFGVGCIEGMEDWKKKTRPSAYEFFREHGVDADSKKITEIFTKFYMESQSGSRPFPDSEELLSFLKSKGKEMSVVSAHPQVLLQEDADNYGFSRFMNSLDGGVTDKAERLKQIADASGIDKSEIAYVGDMVWDIRAAKQAGLRSIAVLRGYHSDMLKKEEPDLAVRSLSELKDHLE